MTTSLYSTLLTAGADRVAQTDPHGWTLTVVSVSVVFFALIVLFFIYLAIGNLSSGKWSLQSRKGDRKPKPAGKKDEVAAAIAMALDAETGQDGTAVAIAAALHLYLSGAVHDTEPGIITINAGSCGKWADKSLTFRRRP